MKAASGLLDLDIAGSGEVELGSRLGHVWNLLCDWGNGDNEAPLVAVCENCPHNASVISVPGRFCGEPVPAELRFHRARLCAVHFYLCPLLSAQRPGYYSAIDQARRLLSRSLGVPAMRSLRGNHGMLSFRWADSRIHMELSASCRDEGRIEVAINDSSVCDWCPSGS